MLSKMADETGDSLMLVLTLPPVLISVNCDISISTRRMNVFVLLVFMLMLVSQVFSLASATFVLMRSLMLMLMSK